MFVQLSSEQSQLGDVASVVDSYLSSNDVHATSGHDAAAALELLTPIIRKLQFRVLALGSRGIECNRHNTDGARSGAAWLGSLLGIAERAAGKRVADYRSMQSNPDVSDLAESGALSFEKATLIARVADGSDSITQQLIAYAHSDSFESLRQRAHDLVTKAESGAERHKRLRKSQFVTIDNDGENMVTGRFRLLPEMAARWLARWKPIEQQAVRDNDELPDPLPRSAARAEAFSSMLSSSGAGSNAAVVNYHVRLEDWQDGWPDGSAVCELAGVGLVPIDALKTISEHPAIRLLITSRNKLLWYSEAGYRPAGPLPEFIKRAVKAGQQDRCSVPGCVHIAEEVDHIMARINGGDNAFKNLQGLCSADHASKTKRDAPWTAGGVYGRRKPAKPLADTG